ncbi:type II toxin-antitoxin system Y4mF family antitoxin [Candidatus Odyssella acanthamoebae]|uniref:Cro/Cl family transcriptional regulator n=1 Tax=Candidatus Odyssella acanthamoebae TaxID=91604 RepID=A0A077ARN1_9PROT|nr:type II toxin-antitoxin system Y4mF family antitoxin [Candidatus Paracaedibacter acanthamoebae]AIK95857.1 Cro/Cl family transcriptional regulator [Candidatus Paracaedibacter acanthamoebae]
MIIKTPKDIGKLIRQKRKEQELTQVELAGLSDVGSRFLVELEQGKATIEIGKALQVMRMLGLSLGPISKSEAGQ